MGERIGKRTKRTRFEEGQNDEASPENAAGSFATTPRRRADGRHHDGARTGQDEGERGRDDRRGGQRGEGGRQQKRPRRPHIRLRWKSSTRSIRRRLGGRLRRRNSTASWKRRCLRRDVCGEDRAVATETTRRNVARRNLLRSGEASPFGKGRLACVRRSKSDRRNGGIDTAVGGVRTSVLDEKKAKIRKRIVWP